MTDYLLMRVLTFVDAFVDDLSMRSMLPRVSLYFRFSVLLMMRRRRRRARRTRREQ